MRVLQICAAYKPAYIYGGPTMSVSMLSEQLVIAGFDTAVYATTANGVSELPVEPGVPTKLDGVTVTYFSRITKDHTHFSPALIKTLWQELPNYSLVHIHAWWNMVSVLSCLIALVRKVPVLLSPRGTLSPYSFQNRNIGPKWLLHQVIGRFLLTNCNIHVTSAREGAATIRLFKPKSITLLPNFVKLDFQKPVQQNSPPPLFRLLFFSRIEEKKGLDVLIGALAGLTFPFHLTIAGDGEKDYIDSLKKIAENKQVDNKITWTGFIDQDKFEFLSRHDIFILPSHDENFGNAVIESLSVGTAVLISEQVGLAEYVKKKKLGWICQTTVSSVAGMLNNIAVKQNAELYRIRNEAPPIIFAGFKEENLVKEYINMYKKLLEND